jgi:hypothetical protein
MQAGTVLQQVEVHSSTNGNADNMLVMHQNPWNVQGAEKYGHNMHTLIALSALRVNTWFSLSSRAMWVTEAV